MSTAAIVTPWYNHLELWPDYREVIDAAEAEEVWIVDNGSSPPLDFSTMRLERNEGFCGGSNAGLHAATTEAVVFLNNDVSLTSREWLEELLDGLEPGVLAGARFRSGAHTIVDGKVLPYLEGWCLAGMRDDLLELGGFDTTLTEPGYFSDNLLCLEARAAGMRLREVEVGLRHKQNASVDDVKTARAVTEANHAVYVARARELMAVTA